MPDGLDLAPERWVRTEGGLGGLPLVARFDHALREVAGRAPWLYFVGITAFLQAPGEDGLPAGAEAQELERLESRLRREFARGAKALPAGAIANGGRVQYVVYAADPEDAKERYRRVCADFPDLGLQLELVEDTAWAVYGQFVR